MGASMFVHKPMENWKIVRLLYGYLHICVCGSFIGVIEFFSRTKLGRIICKWAQSVNARANAPAKFMDARVQDAFFVHARPLNWCDVFCRARVSTWFIVSNAVCERCKYAFKILILLGLAGIFFKLKPVKTANRNKSKQSDNKKNITQSCPFLWLLS